MFSIQDSQGAAAVKRLFPILGNFTPHIEYWCTKTE